MLGDVTNHETGDASGVYSAFAYLAFAVSATWAIAFLADLRAVPVIDGAPSGPAWLAVLVDSGLLLVFAVRHSMMVRTGVKRRIVRVVPQAIERSTNAPSTSLSFGYIALGVRFEERDLRRHLGDGYGEYAQRVPTIVPRPRRSVPPALRVATKAGRS